MGCCLSTAVFGSPFFFWTLEWLSGKSHSEKCKGEYHGLIVTQKDLTSRDLCNTLSHMANVLSPEKQTAIIAALAEGSSIRSIERITGVHRDTIMRLGVKVGKGCEMLMDSKMQDLDCNYLQFDELGDSSARKSATSALTITPNWATCGRTARLIPKQNWCRRSSVASERWKLPQNLCRTLPAECGIVSKYPAMPCTPTSKRWNGLLARTLITVSA